MNRSHAVCLELQGAKDESLHYMGRPIVNVALRIPPRGSTETCWLALDGQRFELTRGQMLSLSGAIQHALEDTA